jgi:TPR repeat protein
VRQTFITISLACLLGVAASASLDLAGDAAAAANNTRARDNLAARAQVLELAERGDVQAQYRLGRMLAEGTGATAPGTPAAVYWYRRAVEQDYAPAEYALGNVFLNGGDVPQDYGAARYWLQRAAGHGNTHAQVELGRMYEQGFGATPDRLMAYVWYDIAANRGDAAGSHARDRLAQSLSPAQLFEAQQVARSISRYVESPDSTAD